MRNENELNQQQRTEDAGGTSGTAAQTAREPATSTGKLCLIKSERNEGDVKLGIFDEPPAGFVKIPTTDTDLRDATARLGAHELRELVVNGVLNFGGY